MPMLRIDRKSTRLNSSHLGISYAVFCLKKKKIILTHQHALTVVFWRSVPDAVVLREARAREESPALASSGPIRLWHPILSLFFFKRSAPTEIFPLSPPGPFPV